MKELQLLLLILKSEENLEIPGVLELLLLVEAKNLIELSGSSTYTEELKKIILALGKMFTNERKGWRTIFTPYSPKGNKSLPS